MCPHSRPTGGLVKLKKNPRKTRIGQTPPTHPNINFFYFYFKTIGNMKTTQKNTQKKKSPQNLNPSWGLTHPPTSEFFSDFWIFFNLPKPLTELFFYVLTKQNKATFCLVEYSPLPFTSILTYLQIFYNLK